MEPSMSPHKSFSLRGRQARGKQARQRGSSRKPLEKMERKGALIDNKLCREKIVAPGSSLMVKKNGLVN
jgi:hypothetical protein